MFFIIITFNRAITLIKNIGGFAFRKQLITKKFNLMNDKNTLRKVFTGREVQGIILKGELEENGIASIIENDFEAGMSAGFASGTAPEVDVYINEGDLKAATPIITEFMKNNMS